MNPRRLLVALLAALLLSGGVTYFLTRRINGRPAPAQTTQKYVAASRPLQAGEVLKPENLTLVEWPAKMPLEGAQGRGVTSCGCRQSPTARTRSAGCSAVVDLPRLWRGCHEPSPRPLRNVHRG